MTIKILSILMILIGAIFLFLSFSPARNIWGNVSGDLRRKWLIILYLMGFFILGYLFFDIILISNLPFPVELVTGGVFLGGAFFVYIIINISQNTIAARQKSEEAIALAKDDWESTFDTVTDMITVHDMDFNIIRANPSAKSILGLRLQEGIPLAKCFRCYHGTEKPPSGCASCQSLQTGKPSTIEMFEPYLNKHLEIRAMPRFGRDRQQVGLIHVVRDITERKRVEEALRESKARFQDLFQEAPVGYFEYDAQGRITNVNQTELDMLGYPLEEMIGQYAWEFIVEQETALQQILAKLAGALAPSRGFERTYRRKDGATFPVLIQDRLMKDEQGNITGIRCAIQDITDRKRVEEALRESEKKYRGILENMDDAYYELDLNGNLVFFNEALISKTGYSRGELMGMNYRHYISPETCKPVSKVFSEIYRTGQPVRLFDYEVIMKGGQTRNYESWANLLFDNNNQPIGFRGMARDITARKQAEERLQKTLESLRKAFGTTIQVMVSAVETRDPYTSGHQIRSADLARAIATEMGLPQDRIDGIRMAGSIHDIGKLSIPAEILSKPTKLSEIEFSLIKEHSRIGYEMLKDVESPWPLAQIVYQHHERMDGSGYPRNLKGDDILIEARILAVADVVEAIASHRPYRPGLGIDAALNEIEKNRGTFYDDAVVDACLRLFREKGFKLEGTWL